LESSLVIKAQGEVVKVPKKEAHPLVHGRKKGEILREIIQAATQLDCYVYTTENG